MYPSQGVFVPPRTATLVVAANDSTDRGKAQADYVCDGANDQIEIQAAINAIAAVSGGTVRLLSGIYNIGATITLTWNVMLEGGFRSTVRLHASAAGLDCITGSGVISGICIEDDVFTFARGFVVTGSSTVRDCSLWGTISIYSTAAVSILDSDLYAVELRGSNNTLIGNIVAGLSLIASQRNVIVSNQIGALSLDATSNWNYLCGNHISFNPTIAGDYNYIVANLFFSDIVGRTGLDVSGSYNKIVANIFDAETGLNISAGTKNEVSNNTFIGNYIVYPLFDSGTLTHIDDNNRGITIDQIKMFRRVKNTSGAQRVAGDVVSLKAVAAGNEVTAPAAIGERQVYGMVAETINANAWGLVQVKGKTIVLKSTNVGGGNIAIGDFLITENGVRARKAAANTDPIFARALEACAAADCVIDAYIMSPWD